MSDRVGVVHFDQGRRPRFLDVPMPAERGPYSEDTARVIDDEVKALVTSAHEAARRILREQRDMLEQVTRRLLEKEVMEGDELRAILSAVPTPQAS
jgi:cell division protease FtsH